MEMIDSSNKGGDTALNIKPDTVTYCGVINCWSKSNRKEAPKRSTDILKIMISKYKEAQAQAQSGNNNGNINNSNIIKPNTIAYNSVMDAYARQGDVDGATKVFNMMKEQHEQEVKFRKRSSGSSSTRLNSHTHTNTNMNAKPNIRSYTILINAWSKKSSSNNKEDDNAPLEAEVCKVVVVVVRIL
jgi:pentatricopeptide repeat protein